MKKFITILLLAIRFLTNTTCFADNTIAHSAKFAHHNVFEQTVYRTATGKKYHAGFFRYLKHSKYPIEKSIAHIAGFTPCKICKP